MQSFKNVKPFSMPIEQVQDDGTSDHYIMDSSLLLNVALSIEEIKSIGTQKYTYKSSQEVFV